MQIILLENIRNLGNIGEIVKVKRGFARNYLIRQGKALNASKENIEIVKKQKDELNKKDLEKKQEAKKKHNVIHKKKYLFTKRAMENGVLYGSLKPKEITKQILDLDTIEINSPLSNDPSTALTPTGSKLLPVSNAISAP